MVTKTQGLSLPLKYFMVIGLVVVAGWMIKNSIESTRVECHMFHGVLVKGTCIYPR